jgi:6-phosphogluconolactonase
MKPELLYVGTHRRAHHADTVDVAHGIYTFRREPADGRLINQALTESLQPGWLAIHPGGRFLYATNEVRNYQGLEGGGVSAFAVDPSGLLSPLNSQRTGSLPCHCEVDATGRFLLVATFAGGTVHLFPLQPDGKIAPEVDVHRHTGSSVHPRQTQPHPHAVSIDPANRFVLVPDLGTDQLVVYELEHANARVVPRPQCNIRLAPGSGPRQIAFGPRARFVYLMNEISSTVTTFAYDATRGGLREIQSTDILPEDFTGLRSGAAIAVHPTGRFLYATTRSHGSSGKPPVRGIDAIAWFDIDQNSGLLRLTGRVGSGGEIPRSFAFDGSGDYLFVGHQCSGTIVTFRIDQSTGAPIATGEVVATPVPVCLRMAPRTTSDYTSSIA